APSVSGFCVFTFVSGSNPLLLSGKLMDFVEILEHHLLDHKIARLFAIGHATFYLTTHNLMMLIASALLLGLLLIARRQAGIVSTGWANFFEVFIVYIRDEIVRPNLGAAG